MKRLLPAFLLLISCMAYGQVDLNLGLRAYYPFSGNSNDVSGNNNNPIFNNAVLTADHLGNPNSAYHFNGVDNYMQIPNSPSLNMANAISISVWVKPTGYYTGQCYNNMLVMKGDGDFLPGNYFLRFSDAYNGCSSTPSTADERFYGNGIVAPLPLVQLNQWYSVVCTYDGTTARIYVNCELKASAVVSITGFTNGYNVFLGHLNNTQFPYWLNGDLDEVRIYDRALNQDEVNVLGGCTVLPCNNWLSTPSSSSYMRVGDLDIPGNQVTIEATINRTQPYLPGGGNDTEGDVVSKHTDFTDVNYLLRPNHAYITTTNGFFGTPDVCDLELNKTYHVALVYDGTTLKFYRDGFLMSQVAATGNLVQNNLNTQVGLYDATVWNTQFLGYVNEVRIWNVARTQSQIQANMNSSLPNPTTQPGLQAYYTFDNLLNQQGNAAWNGTLSGAASINATNTSCDFIADSCNIIPTVITSFSAPDTVCVNTPVQVTNTSVGATSYYWSFCEANTSSPVAADLGTLSSQFSQPVFTDLVKDDAGNYFGFVSDHQVGSLTRLTFGNSLLNTPTAESLLSGLLPIPNLEEGVQVVKANGNWTAIMVGGGVGSSYIIKLDFGVSLSNQPTLQNWGNIGNLNVPHDLYVFQQNNNWYGYTINANTNSITRFNFGTDFTIPPTGTNLGNIAGLNAPVGLGTINQGGNWYMFVTNAGNSTLSRLDFGNSLLNTPTGINIGNPGNILNNPRDISFIDLCEGIVAFSVNATNNTIAKLNFGSDLTSIPATSSLGNLGNLNFPHSISELFREDNDIYAFIPNVNTNAITRLRFAGCSGIPGSTLQNPPPVSYTVPGTYNINLLTDIGLPTQGSFCKQIVVKSCLGISNIINEYTPVLAFDPCDNKLTVEDATKYNIGDTVLLIQMKGAAIDSTNTANFGTITDYKNAGNYEFNYVKSKTGNDIELKNKLTRQYDIPVGKVQLIRVPYYNNATIDNTLTALPWDGSKGGVLVLNAQNTVTLNADIDVSGKGFKGGLNGNNLTNAQSCSQTGYSYATTSQFGAPKGEGIAIVSSSKMNGRGALANGGGGGNDHNSGGGGGSNIAAAGNGGYQFSPCTGGIFDNRGLAGKALTYSTASNKIFLGGGGGSGHANNIEGFNPNGGNGGGIVFIICNDLVNNGFSINTNGTDGSTCTSNTANTNCNEGMGGGGAGGSVLINSVNYTNNIPVNAKGGKGADVNYFAPTIPTNYYHGPGGGGGAGVLWVNNASVSGNITFNSQAGVNGTNILYANNAWGATAGQNGQSLVNLSIPVDNILFVPNIDSVRIENSSNGCRDFNFHGLGYTNTNPIVSWHWNFGDNSTANTQDANHTYSGAGTFTITLVVTDINGCKDSIITTVIANTCVANTISGIINDYTPVIALNPCNNGITVEDATHFNIGDTVLIIQMKGALIDTTNTATFGTIIDYKNAGNYEYNYVKNKTGNIIELKNVLTRQYDIPVGKVQLVRVPYYISTTVTSTLTCLPWDGKIGGILVFNVKDTLVLLDSMTVAGRGFMGGHVTNTNLNGTNCFTNNYFYPMGSIVAAPKGESIASIGDDKLSGKGSNASGGGGGLDHNSGGGGGGNGGVGGFGGYQLYECGPSFFDNRGIGGIGLNYSNTANRIFLGGGGGAGHCNNGFSNPLANTNYNGGNGGGIILVNANRIIGNDQLIFAKGDSAYELAGTGGETHDGMGGGGAGGTVLIKTNQFINNAHVEVGGGKGGDMHASMAGGHIGPGGGGAGGITWLSLPSLPANIFITNNGGRGGYLLQDSNNPFGATGGSGGTTLFDLVLPADGPLFKPNIDSVRIKDSSIACLAFDFHGFGYTNTNPIASWNWNFGDNGTANTQNTSHTYGAAGTYTVTLVVTDINGCKDSIIKDVVSNTLSVNAGSDSSFCGGPVSVQLHGTGSGTLSWTPAIYLDNSTIADPIATVSSTTTFYLNVLTATGCSGKDSVTINVDSAPVVSTLNDTSICKGDVLILTTTNSAPIYHWSPGTLVSDSLIASPVFTGTGTTTLIVTGTTLGLCAASDTITVTVDPLPLVNAGKDTLICSTQPTGLTATGASIYNWSPPTFLDDPNSATPIFSGNTSTTYFLTGTDANGCKGKDTISVTVNTPGSFVQPPGKSFCAKETVELDGNNGNNVQYLWSPGTDLSSTTIINPVANPASTTTYTVLVTDVVCNDDSLFSVVVTVNPLPAVNATRSNDIDCSIKNSHLTASGASQYLWTPAGSLTNASISNPIATPTASTQYIVTGTDNAGCKNKDSVMVLVKGGVNGYDIPNSFTPNGDGLNDCFGIRHWGDAQDVYFIIYNRWGEKVFETHNVNICWDGTYKGVPADAGNYVFYAKALTACGEMIRKGNVLLIR